MDKVTIYKKGGLGNIVKVEARTASIERGAYAQYTNAIKVRYIPKGARRERGFVETYRPHLLVLAGHGHPDPAGIFDGGKVSQGAGMTCIQSKHSAFDGGYEADFDALINEHIERTGAKVVLDARGEHIA